MNLEAIKQRFPHGGIDATRMAISAILLAHRHDGPQKLYDTSGVGGALYLIGEPGSGKTETVRSALGLLYQNDQCHIDQHYIEIKGSELFRPENFACPGRDEGDLCVKMYPAERFMPAFERPTMVFLDEANQAPPDSQAFMMPMAQELSLVGRMFFPGSIVVMAGNPGRSGVGTRQMGPALVSRLAPVFLSPTIAEKAALKDAGYPALDMRFDNATYEAQAAYYDSMLSSFWTEVENTCPKEQPADWQGEPIASSRSWEIGVRYLAMCDALHRDYACVLDDSARSTAREIALATKVGNERARAFVKWMNLAKLVDPIKVLEDGEHIPVMSGPKAGAWLGLYQAEALRSPARLLCVASTIPRLLAAFSPDLLLPRFKAIANEGKGRIEQNSTWADPWLRATTDIAAGLQGTALANLVGEVEALMGAM